MTTEGAKMDSKLTWKGRPIESLSREELIQAFSWAAHEIKRMRETHHHEMEMLAELGRARR